MIGMLVPGSYVELAESVPATAASLRALGASGELEVIVRSLQQEAARLVGAHAGAALDQLAIWHIDFFYRLFNRLEFVDQALLSLVHAISEPLAAALTAERKAIAYLVDNQLPHDRLMVSARFFGAMGRTVASPELMAAQLAEHDGVVVEDVAGAHLARYLDEATRLALALVEQAIARGASFLWLSGESSLDVYQHVASLLDERYLGVFRNTEPVDGSNVQVFRGLGRSVAIDPQY